MRHFMFMFITMSIYLLINSYNVNGQTSFSVDKWMEYMEEMAANTDDNEKIETLYSELSYLTEHPFDLNTVTEQQLKKLPFLSDFQINNIMRYRKRYGNMATVYELKNIEGLDFQTIELLLPFVYIGVIPVDNCPVTVKNMLKYGSNELYIRYDKCFQQKKGYSSYPDSILQEFPNRKYIGEPFYTSLRYSYSFKDKIYFGVVAEKDAGEPFWNGYHKGYDYYSLHLLLRDIKMLKTLLIGDYKVSFGQGLVVSNDFSLSRTTIVTQAERRTNGFRRHFSTNENDFFRGTAATVNLKNIDISLFYSLRKLDAKVEDHIFTSIKTDGYHRLERDREKMNNIKMQTIGGNIQYNTSNVCLGITALSYSFGKDKIMPEPKPYNIFYFRGDKNINASVNYLLKNNKMKFYGETAISRNKAFATLNAFQLMPASYISLLLLYRYYDRRYQAYFGNAFSQNSSVQNEQGLYMGIQLTPFAYWKCSAYADFFRFPWLKYGVDSPSTGREYMVQVDYTGRKNFSVYIRYKYRRKEKNESLSDKFTTVVLPYTQQRVRIQANYHLSSLFIFKTSADAVVYNESTKNSKGYMVSQSFGWKPSSLPVQIDLYTACFFTDDYSSRVSSYEKNILYVFNMPSFYGKGLRLSTTFRWDILKRVSLSAKFAYTHYMDRNVIGTDLEEIEGSDKTDIYAMLRWKF